MRTIANEFDAEALSGQINAATANGFRPDTVGGQVRLAGRISDGEVWYRTDRSRLVLRGEDGADLHVFDGPIDTSLLAFSIRFDGSIPAEALEAAVRGAM